MTDITAIENGITQVADTIMKSTLNLKEYAKMLPFGSPEQEDMFKHIRAVQEATQPLWRISALLRLDPAYKIN